jgi:hypothetical protein
MAASSSTTEATTAIQAGTGRLLSRPQPRFSPASARLTAVAGSKTLMNTVFNATIDKLLGQRRSLEYDFVRRGATASHSAIAVKIVMNALRRMAAS